MDTTTVTRSQLYEEVWSIPMMQLAPKYHMSDVGLKKICKKMNIPTPPRGYWAKRKHGKKVEQKPLPESATIQEWTFNLNARPNWNQPKKTVKKARSSVNPGVDISVSKHLHSPHNLIKTTLDRLQKENPDHWGRVRAWSDSCLDVYISPDSIKRTMRIFDALLKGLIKLGYQVVTERDKLSRSYFLIDNEKVGFCMREKGYRKKHTPTEEEKKSSGSIPVWDYYTTGKLRIELEGYWGYEYTGKKKWWDTKNKKLEQQLNEVAVGVLEAAHAIKEEKIRREKEQIRKEKRKRIHQEEEHQAKVELERRRQLEVNAEQFTKSRYIYDLIASVERESAKMDLSEQQQLQLKGWLHWATAHANRLNPLKRTLKSILDYTN